MSFVDLLLDIISSSLGFFYALVGVIIIIKAKRKALNNMMFYGAGLMCIGTSYILALIPNIIGVVGSSLSAICFLLFIVFIERTFFKGEKSPYKSILVFGLVFGFSSIILSFLADITAIVYIDNFGTFFFASLVMLSASWATITPLKAYRNVKSLDIEPFVKKRFLYFGINNIVLILLGALQFIQTILIFGRLADDSLRNMVSLIITIPTGVLGILYVIISYLLWITPIAIKNYFNKGYQHELEEELSEDEIMKRMKEK